MKLAALTIYTLVNECFCVVCSGIFTIQNEQKLVNPFDCEQFNIYQYCSGACTGP
jgi:hypothetical protein